MYFKISISNRKEGCIKYEKAVDTAERERERSFPFSVLSNFNFYPLYYNDLKHLPFSMIIDTKQEYIYIYTYIDIDIVS